MKAPLTEINIAGTFTVEVDLKIHAKSRKAIDLYLMELADKIEHVAMKTAEKKVHPLNLRSVVVQVRHGR